ncbi:hypothetical protein TYRP_007027 [Tyrophagus putrescentiae]|nr:hypothetical protein TYRP_007027 [Tyrophagus putrescentiae]
MKLFSAYPVVDELGQISQLNLVDLRGVAAFELHRVKVLVLVHRPSTIVAIEVLVEGEAVSVESVTLLATTSSSSSARRSTVAELGRRGDGAGKEALLALAHLRQLRHLAEKGLVGGEEGVKGGGALDGRLHPAHHLLQAALEAEANVGHGGDQAVATEVVRPRGNAVGRPKEGTKKRLAKSWRWAVCGEPPSAAHASSMARSAMAAVKLGRKKAITGAKSAGSDESTLPARRWISSSWLAKASRLLLPSSSPSTEVSLISGKRR